MFKFCSSPFSVISVDHSANVYPCLCADWHSYGSIGNLTKNTLLEIFNGELAKNFRSTILDQSYKYCKSSCYRLWNLDEVQQFPAMVDQLNLLPTNFILSIDLNCNLRCASCRNSNIFASAPNPITELILDNINNSYQDYNGQVQLKCDGAGDIFASTAYKNFFAQKDIAKSFQFHLITNGLLVTKNLDLIDNILPQLGTVEVSFDAANKETYDQVRGGKWNLLIDGIQALVSRGIQVNTQYVVQQLNYKEILQYRDLCKQLGVSHIGLQSISERPHMNPTWWQQNRLDNNSGVDMQWLVPALTELHQDSHCGLSGGLIELIN